MLRRHSWFMPGEHVVLGAAGERDLEDVLRLAGGEPALDRLRPPAELVQLGDHPGAAGAALGGRHVAEAAYGGSAMPSLTCAALQRRVTTGGPIRTPNAPCSFRWAAIGASQAPRSSSSQSMTGPSGR